MHRRSDVWNRVALPPEQGHRSDASESWHGASRGAETGYFPACVPAQLTVQPALVCIIGEFQTASTGG